MKLPYRCGDSFALPVGNGRCVAARITSCDHHVVGIEACGIHMRAYDSALVLHRWRPSATPGEAFDHRAVDTLHDPSTVLRSAKAERVMAQYLGVQHFEAGPVAVRSIGGEIVESSAGLRLNRDPGTHLPRIAAAQIDALTIGVAVDAWPVALPNIRRLTLDARCEMRGLAEAFPNLERLRIGDGVRSFDAHHLVRMQNLIELDVAHVQVERVDALAALPRLRALRLAHIAHLRTLEPLEGIALEVLAIEALPALEPPAALRACTSLEQIELRAMWQWTIEECAWLFDLPNLVRVEADIGGRRKNVELYRRARWAHPWPVFSDARVTSVAPLERSD